MNKDIKLETINIINEWSDKDVWLGYDKLKDALYSKTIVVTKNRLKTIIKELRTAGIIELKPTFKDGSYSITGKGYFISKKCGYSCSFSPCELDDSFNCAHWKEVKNVL